MKIATVTNLGNDFEVGLTNEKVSQSSAVFLTNKDPSSQTSENIILRPV